MKLESCFQIDLDEIRYIATMRSNISAYALLSKKQHELFKRPDISYLLDLTSFPNEENPKLLNQCNPIVFTLMLEDGFVNISLPESSEAPTVRTGQSPIVRFQIRALFASP